MSYNKELLKSRLSDVKKKTFKEAIYLCYRDGVTSVAPLGFSGDTIILFGEENGGRKSLVSIRNYGHDAELLITDTKGNFLFYGRFHISMGLTFIVNSYWNIFKSVYKFIESEIPARPDWAKMDIADNATQTIGFDMLRAYQSRCLHFS